LAAARACSALAKAGPSRDALHKAIGHTECALWMPVVVIDGNLFDAFLLESGELSVTRIDWGRLLLKNPDSGNRETAIDVVTSSFLDGYIAQVRQSSWALRKLVEAKPEIATDAGLAMKRLLAQLPSGGSSSPSQADS